MTDPTPPSKTPPPTTPPRTHPLADIFPDSPPSTPNLAPPPSSPPSEIPRLRATHNTAGYRSGISASKSASLQPGFDEGYSLGAVLGLRVGYVLGVLEGLCVVVTGEEGGSGGEGEEEEKGEGVEGSARDEVRRGRGRRGGGGEMKRLLEDARRELGIENVFAREWWGEDGIWRFDVGRDGDGNGGEITFERVAERHPLLRKWVFRVEEEMERLGVGVGEGRFEGKEWEGGRV